MKKKCDLPRYHLKGCDCHHTHLIPVAGLAETQQEIERLRGLLRQWQFDVGGASERLERETLAAINAVPQSEEHK